MFRRSIFSERICWDSDIKINGEHEDFYLNLRLNTDLKVAYLPSMAALHLPAGAGSRYRTALRDRHKVGSISDASGTLINMWRSRYALCDRGTNSCISARMQAFARTRSSRAWHRFNRDAPRRRLPTRVPVLTAEQKPNVPWSKSPMSCPDEPKSDRVTAAILAKSNGSGPRTMYRFDSGGISRDEFPPQCIALRLRWTDDSGRALMWESPRIVIELQHKCWCPCLAPAPVWPTGARQLRFDIVAERGDDRIPVATGTLHFAEPDAREDDHVALRDLPQPTASGAPHFELTSNPEERR